MSTLRSAIWRIAQSTTECSCAICTSCTGSGRIASPAAARQPSSRTPAQQQDASPAAGRQPGSSPPAQQQPASPAAARQPSSRTPARQQPASQAAGRQPSSRAPAQQQDASRAAMLYTRLRGRAHPLRAALMFPRVPARTRRYCARARGLCGFGSAKVG